MSRRCSSPAIPVQLTSYTYAAQATSSNEPSWSIHSQSPHLGLAVAEELVGPAVHAGDRRLAVEVRHGGTALAGRLHLVDPASGVALLVALQAVGAKVGFSCSSSSQLTSGTKCGGRCTPAAAVRCYQFACLPKAHDCRLAQRTWLAQDHLVSSKDRALQELATAAVGRTLAAAVAGAARRDVPVAHLDVVGEADDVLDAAAGSKTVPIKSLGLAPSSLPAAYAG